MTVLAGAVLIGAGRMGGAMVRGWLGAPLEQAGLARLHVVEPTPGAELLAAAAQGRLVLNATPVVADIVVLGVKPQAFPALAADIARWVGPGTLVMSIMAGVTINQLVQAFEAPRIVRAMPNTPGAIGLGITAFSLSDACTRADTELTERLLASLGEVIGPLPESAMDAVTAVSGSGPAYVFLLAEAMEEAGRAAGLDAATASRLARATVVGAGALLNQGEEPAALRHAVTSPAGATEAALNVLMAVDGLPDLMRRAVAAAARRAGELSSGVYER